MAATISISSEGCQVNHEPEGKSYNQLAASTRKYWSEKNLTSHFYEDIVTSHANYATGKDSKREKSKKIRDGSNPSAIEEGMIPKASHDNDGEAESENNDGESEVVLNTLSLLKHSQ